MTDEHPPTHRKVALVTGATSGIGRAAAVSLAYRGYRIIAVGRDANRGVGVVDELERVGAGGTFLPCDLLDLADVRRLAREVSERHRRLDVLLNNAGGTFRAKALTPEGIEYTFALNAVAPYALTTALLPPLQAGAGRVVNVVTRVSARTRLGIDGLTDPPRYNAFAAYSRAKLALMALTLEQAARYAEAGITPVAVHPGIVFGTRFGNDMPAWLNRLGPIAARLLRRPTSSVVDAGDLLAYAATTALNPAPSSPKRGPTNLPPLRQTPSSESGSGNSSRLSRTLIRSPEARSLATPYRFRHRPNALRGRPTGGPVSLRVGRERFVTLAAGPLPTLSTSPQERRTQARGLHTPNM